MKILPWQTLTHMFTEQTMADEMVKKFKGTVMQLIGEQNLFATYQGYGTDTVAKELYHIFETKNGETIRIFHNTDTEVLIPNPRRGLYNTQKGVVLFYRLPFRQHKRGLYNETAYIGLVQNKIFQHMNPNRFSQHIYDVLDKEQQVHVNLDEAKEKCNSNFIYALNRDFGLLLHPNKESGYALIYEDCYVGDVEDKTINVKNKLFYQETIDALPKIGPDYSVRLTNE